MTDVPADSGGSRPQPAEPSDQPVIRRSNYAPPPPDAEPPRFDDDALAEALAAEVRPYTQPISLPEPAPTNPDAVAPVAPAMPAESTRAPVLSPPVDTGGLPPAPTPDASSVPSWDGVAAAAAEPAAAEPAAAEPAGSSSAASAPEVPHGEEDLLRSLGSASTLEAIERLERELRLRAGGEAAPGETVPSEAVPSEAAPGEAAPAEAAPGGVAQTPPPPFEAPPSGPEPALEHPVAAPAAPAPAPPPASTPPLPEVDESLIDPDAVAELGGSASGAPESWWAADQVGGTWDIPAAPTAPVVSDTDHAEAAPGFPQPFSTEPPVGPESPDWLDAPPPSYEPPELVEPPSHPATAGVEPLTPEAMTRLPRPLPTEQPKIEDRAELPPPPGYDDIPIMWGDVASAPPPVAPNMVFPLDGEAPTLQANPLHAAEATSLDHDDDDVIDEVDRVSGTGAIPVSSAGTAEPLAPPSEPIPTIRLNENEPALIDEKPQQPPAFEVESAGAEPTALDLRAGRAARLFWLWFAANSSVLSLGLGAVLLGTGMSLRQSIVAALAGVAISFLPLGLGTLAGKWSGQPTMIVSRAAFGHLGNILPALLAVGTRVLWGGVLLWVLATAVAQVLVGAGLDAGLGTTVWQLVGLVAGFVIAAVVAVFGYGFIAKLQLVLSIVTAALIVGAAVLTFRHLDFATALTVPDGSWVLVIPGAALVFGVVGLAWVHSSSDLARYQRPASYGGSSMLWATFGATLPPFALISWGAMLAASDPSLATGLRSNPLAALAGLLPSWYPAPLLAAAALGLLSGAVLTMYSGGFALQALGVRARRGLTTFVSAILVLAAGGALIFVVTDFSSLLRDLVITVAVPVAAWAGIFAAEMMMRSRRFHSPSLLTSGGVYPQVRWVNFLALIVISAVGLGLVESSIPWLRWEGFLYRALGIGTSDLLASSDAGVFVALLLAILVTLISGGPAIRKQERSPVPD